MKQTVTTMTKKEKAQYRKLMRKTGILGDWRHGTRSRKDTTERRSTEDLY